MTKKPCINCGEQCDVLPVQLGDFFTLTYLRVCGGDCMFIIAYDYLYEIGHHKDFRNKLYDLQNEEDKKERDDFIDTTSEIFLGDFKGHLGANPNMLSTPAPVGIMEMFAEAPKLPPVSGGLMRFIRPNMEDKLIWARRHVEDVKQKLKDAEDDLEKLLNEQKPQ